MPYLPTSTNTAEHALNDDGEMLLYGFHGWMLSLAMDLKFGRKMQPDDVEKSLAYLDDKDPARARLVRGCLHLIGVMVEEATTLLDHGIHWPTIEAMFCPDEDGFLDTPNHWIAIGQGQCQEEGQRQNTQIVHAEIVEPDNEKAPPALPPAEAPRRRASANALRSLGRSIRSEVEYEKRRFYAIARDHGLATDSSAAPYIRAALSELLGEPVASRKQLTARQWGFAASSIQTEDLLWSVPAPRPRGRPRAEPQGIVQPPAMSAQP
jgi:hypothetical protein